jgi:hypothetical protein
MLLLDYAYSDDPIAPLNIKHGLDAMLTPDGEAFEFHYNYLVYTFRHNGEELLAKHYMDQTGEVSISQSINLPVSGFVLNVLVFLGLRYISIKMLTDTGYVPLPDDIQKQVSERVHLHFLK